ncbi:general control of amino acid synthesis-like protein [Cokeromyces recurvatus]|uniref:general control of amino acid synthesis-like protein n=1 Tax=Cokeromyces recurvatus TaxID=90255 RepID=UPI00221EAD85|nr:general control of amino acid synthesis-like protein [Cokeromyces recurvatus]KAI7904779.1 general control of amino acid synthesis-like protein [Cokeromyces recurvatus]
MSDSLSHLLKEHNQKRAQKKKQNEQIKKNAIQTTHELTDMLTEYVNEGVSEIFSKQKQLEQHSKKLANQTTRYMNQTQQWLKLVDDFNMSLKELGDVRNWAEIMEHDMKTIMTTLEFVHQGIIA